MANHNEIDPKRSESDSVTPKNSKLFDDALGDTTVLARADRRPTHISDSFGTINTSNDMASVNQLVTPSPLRGGSPDDIPTGTDASKSSGTTRPQDNAANASPLIGGTGDTKYTPAAPGGNTGGNPAGARSLDAPFVPGQASPGYRAESAAPNNLNQIDSRTVPSRPTVGTTDASFSRDSQPVNTQSYRAPVLDASAPRSSDSVTPKRASTEVRSSEIQPPVASSTTTSLAGPFIQTVSNGQVKVEKFAVPESLSANQPGERNATPVPSERNAVVPTVTAPQDGPSKVVTLADVSPQPRSTNTGDLASASIPARTQVEQHNDSSLPSPKAGVTANPSEAANISRPEAANISRAAPANAQDGQSPYKPAAVIPDAGIKSSPASSDNLGSRSAPTDLLVRLQNPGTTSLDAQRLPTTPVDTRQGNNPTGDSIKSGTSSGTPDAFGARKETGIQLPDARQTTGRSDSSVQLPDTKQSTGRTDGGGVSNPGLKPDTRTDLGTAKPDAKTLSVLDQKFGDKINPPGGSGGIPVIAPGLPDIFGGFRGDKDSRTVKDSKVDPAAASDNKDVRGQLTGAKDVKDGRGDSPAAKDSRADLTGSKDSKTPDGKSDTKGGATVDDRIVAGQKTNRADATEAGNKSADSKTDSKTPQDTRAQSNDGRLAPDGRPTDGRQQGGSNLVHDGGAVGDTRTDQSGARIIGADGKLISGRTDQGAAIKNDVAAGGKGLAVNPGGDKPFILPPGSLPVPDLVGGIKNIGQQIDARTGKIAPADDAGKGVKHTNEIDHGTTDGIKSGAADGRTIAGGVKSGVDAIKGGADGVQTVVTGGLRAGDKTTANTVDGTKPPIVAEGKLGDSVRTGFDGVKAAANIGDKIGDGIKGAIIAGDKIGDGVRTVITGGLRAGDIRNTPVPGSDKSINDSKAAIAGGAKPGENIKGAITGTDKPGDGVKTAITGGARTGDVGSPTATGGAKISDSGRPVITGEPNDSKSAAARNPLAGKSDVAAVIPPAVALGEMVGNLKAIAARIFPPESLVGPFDNNLPGRKTERLEGAKGAIGAGLRAESTIPIIRLIGENVGRADEKFVIKVPQPSVDANAPARLGDANSPGKFGDVNAPGKLGDANAPNKFGDANATSKLNDATAATKLADGKLPTDSDQLMNRKLTQPSDRAELQHPNAKAADAAHHTDKHEAVHDEAAERVLSNLELVGSIESVGAVEMEEEEVFPLAAIEYFGGDFEKSISDEEEVSFDGDGKVADDDEQSTRYQYIVEAGDTVELIATKVFKNLTLAPLIYEINKDSIPIGMQDGRMVFLLKVGMIIWLPFPKEVKEYMQRFGGGGEL